MASDKLVPAFARILYHSGKAPHVKTVPLRNLVFSTIGTPPEGIAWDGSTISMDTAMEDLIDLWAAMVDNALTFDRYQIFSFLNPALPPIWVFEKAYSVVGSATITAGQTYAVQHTMTFRSDNNGLFKWVTLDRNSGGFWGRSYVPSAIEQDMIDYIVSDVHNLAAQDNGRPVSFLRLTVSENDRLAREYHQSL